MIIVDWLMANWLEVSAAFAAGYAFALSIAKLTPTTIDDEILAALEKFFGKPPTDPPPK